MEVFEVVNILVVIFYFGIELWYMDNWWLIIRDYWFFDIQYVVLFIKLLLDWFYVEFVKMQQVMNKKYLRWKVVWDFFFVFVNWFVYGQINFFQMLWKFNFIYDKDLFFVDYKCLFIY